MFPVGWDGIEMMETGNYSQSGSNAALAPWRLGTMGHGQECPARRALAECRALQAGEDPKAEAVLGLFTCLPPSSAAQKLPRLDWEQDGD